MNKKNLILGGVLIVLAAFAYFYQWPFKEWRAELNQPKNFLAAINSSQIDKIEIIKSQATTTLEKDGSRWKIAGTKDFYVSDDIANSLATRLDEAAKAEAEVASRQKNKKQEFKTDKDNGTEVILKQGDKVAADMIVGKLANDLNSTYISPVGSDTTYSIKANLNNTFDRDDWYDKTIFSGSADKITKLRFQYPTREFTVEKKDGKWSGVLPYKFKVDEDKVKEIVDIMSNLNAVKIPKQDFAGTGLDKHLIIVQATGDGVDNTIMVGNSSGADKKFYYAKKGNSDNIYLISKSDKERLDKQIRDFQ